MVSNNIEAPDGWTADPEAMNVEYYWKDNTRGRAAALARGLFDPTPLMCLDPEDGGDQFLFTSGGKYYLWNIVTDDVSLITSPTSQDDIIKALGDMLLDDGSKDLKMEYVPLQGQSPG